MSNIEPNIIDPTGNPPPPDVIIPEIDPENDLVGDDMIREPDSDALPIEPDPEERTRDLPPIRRAEATSMRNLFAGQRSTAFESRAALEN